jgi:hypothetical protein
MDTAISPIISAVIAAAVGGLIGFCASTYGASFNQDRTRKIRAIGIAKALLADVRRLNVGLGSDCATFLHRLGGVRRVPPTISPWVESLIAEIALESADVVSRYMDLEVQLHNLGATIALVDAAQRRAESAEEARTRVSHNTLIAFTDDNKPVYPADVEAARDDEAFARDEVRAAIVTVKDWHQTTRDTLTELASLLTPLANAPMPDRTPFPATD